MWTERVLLEVKETTAPRLSNINVNEKQKNKREAPSKKQTTTSPLSLKT